MNKLLKTISIVFTTLTFIIAVVAYIRLPEQVVVSFNATGQLVEFENKINVWSFPLGAIVSYVLFTWLMRVLKPNVFVLEDNDVDAERYYLRQLSLLNGLRVGLSLVFLLCVVNFILMGMYAIAFPSWLIVGVVGLIMLYALGAAIINGPNK